MAYGLPLKLDIFTKRAALKAPDGAYTLQSSL